MRNSVYITIFILVITSNFIFAQNDTLAVQDSLFQGQIKMVRWAVDNCYTVDYTIRGRAYKVLEEPDSNLADAFLFILPEIEDKEILSRMCLGISSFGDRRFIPLLIPLITDSKYDRAYIALRCALTDEDLPLFIPMIDTFPENAYKLIAHCGDTGVAYIDNMLYDDETRSYAVTALRELGNFDALKALFFYALTDSTSLEHGVCKYGIKCGFVHRDNCRTFLIEKIETGTIEEFKLAEAFFHYQELYWEKDALLNVVDIEKLRKKLENHEGDDRMPILQLMAQAGDSSAIAELFEVYLGWGSLGAFNSGKWEFYYFMCDNSPAYPYYISQLDSPVSERRHAALALLFRQGGNREIFQEGENTEYIEKLMDLSKNDPDDNTRRFAIKILSSCEACSLDWFFEEIASEEDSSLAAMQARWILALHKNTSVVERLIQALLNKEPNMNETIRSLGVTGDPRAVEPIIKMINWEDKEFETPSAATASRNQGLIALGEIGDESAIPILQKYAAGHERSRLTNSAKSSLMKIDANGPIESIATYLNEPKTRIWAIKTLGYKKDCATIPYLIPFTDSSYYTREFTSTRDSIYWEFEKYDLIDALLEAVDSIDQPCALPLIKAIEEKHTEGYWGFDMPEHYIRYGDTASAIGYLINCSHECDMDIGCPCLDRLLEMGDTSVIEPLYNHLIEKAPYLTWVFYRFGNPAEPYLVKSLDSKNPAVVEPAITALGLLADTTITLQIIPFILDTNRRVQRAAIDASGDLKDVRTIPNLMKVVEDTTNVQARHEAIRALGAIGDPDILKHLVPFINDTAYGVGGEALMAIAKYYDYKGDTLKTLVWNFATNYGLDGYTLGKVFHDDLDTLLGLLDSDNIKYKFLTVEALKYVDNGMGEPALLEIALGQGNEKLRVRAVYHLGLSRNPEVIAGLRRLAREDEYEEIRNTAINVYWRMDDYELALEDLEYISKNDPSAIIKQRCRNTIARIQREKVAPEDE